MTARTPAEILARGAWASPAWLPCRVFWRVAFSNEEPSILFTGNVRYGVPPRRSTKEAPGAATGSIPARQLHTAVPTDGAL